MRSVKLLAISLTDPQPLVPWLMAGLDENVLDLWRAAADEFIKLFCPVGHGASQISDDCG
jgi:hypothetical protein